MVDRVPKELHVAVGALCLIESAPKESAQKFKHIINHPRVIEVEKIFEGSTKKLSNG